jgi:hypothetical protein
LGGAAGGWLYGEFGPATVFLFSASVAGSWIVIALFMSPPRYWANLLLSLKGIKPEQGDEFSRKLLTITGIEEVRLHFEENAAYLKVDSQQLNKDELNYLLKQWQ